MASIGQRLGYLAFRFAECLLRSLPPGAAIAVGQIAGWAVWVVDSRHRWRALESVRVAYGAERSPSEQRALARAAFLHFGQMVAEATHFDRQLGTLEQLKRKVRLRGDWEPLFADLFAGRGGMIVTGHLGNWELGARAFRLYGIPVRVVFRALDNPLLNDYVIRSRGGPQAVIRRQGALGGMQRALRDGAWVGILADTNAGNRGEFAPFFGLPASTFGTPILVAVRERAPFYAGAAIRRAGRPFRFDLVVRRIALPTDSGASVERVRNSLGEMNAALEALVRLAPEQYHWIHRRWKVRPPDEAPGPHLPRYDRRRLSLKEARRLGS